MKYVNFPGTQEQVSAIGLGTWVFGGENWGGADDAACVAAVHEAMALGMKQVAMTDHGVMYGSGFE